MLRIIVSCLLAGFLVVPPARAQIAKSPLCEVGGAAIELLEFSDTTRFVPTNLRSSVILLAECPSSIVPAFTATDGSGKLRARWIAAIQSAAGDSSSADLRAFLAEAQPRIVRLRDSTLNAFLDGIFEGLVNPQRVDRLALDSLFERQAVATLGGFARCGGAACYNLSDNLLFLLGTHTVPMLKAMGADSAEAAKWLRSLADASFAGDSEHRDVMEAARRSVIATLSRVRAVGTERERRACVRTLQSIRYQVLE